MKLITSLLRGIKNVFQISEMCKHVYVSLTYIYYNRTACRMQAFFNVSYVLFVK